MNVTDFLTARLGEEEAAARTLSHYSATFNDGRVPMRVECNPTHVLTDVAAHRRLLELHTQHEIARPPGGGPVWVCAECRRFTPCRTLLTLAYIYRTHPDYQEEWLA